MTVTAARAKPAPSIDRPGIELASGMTGTSNAGRIIAVAVAGLLALVLLLLGTRVRRAD